MVILSAHFSHPCPFLLPPIAPPAPDSNNKDVKQVKSDHEKRLPEVNVTVVEDAEGEEDRECEETGVTKKSPSSDSEGRNEGHRSAASSVSRYDERFNEGEGGRTLQPRR
jgi:hypothetical protein